MAASGALQVAAQSDCAASGLDEVSPPARYKMSEKVGSVAYDGVALVENLAASTYNIKQ